MSIRWRPIGLHFFWLWRELDLDHAVFVALHLEGDAPRWVLDPLRPDLLVNFCLDADLGGFHVAGRELPDDDDGLLCPPVGRGFVDHAERHRVRPGQLFHLFFRHFLSLQLHLPLSPAPALWVRPDLAVGPYYHPCGNRTRLPPCLEYAVLLR